MITCAKHFKLFCYIFCRIRFCNIRDTAEGNCRCQWQFGWFRSWFWSWKWPPSRCGKCCKATSVCTPCRNVGSNQEMSRSVFSQNRRPVHKCKRASRHTQSATLAWCRGRTDLRWWATLRLQPHLPNAVLPILEWWSTWRRGSWCGHALKAAHLRPPHNACRPQN